MSSSYWPLILKSLQAELAEQPFNTWVKPLQVQEDADAIRLLAPNKFFSNWIQEKYLPRIQGLAQELAGLKMHVNVEIIPSHVGAPAFLQSQAMNKQVFSPQSVVEPNTPTQSRPEVSQQWAKAIAFEQDSALSETEQAAGDERLLDTSFYDKNLLSNQLLGTQRNNAASAVANAQQSSTQQSHLNLAFTFNSFVQGKSNQLALAAARQVVENPGSAYNPLFIYGGVGLGKTHLMHAVGSALLERKPNARVIYLHSERFVADMVKAFQLNAINDFKRFYRSVDALLIDDIQFFAGKERSQEELFHTFNALLEGGQQMILTCDRYPKEIEGLEERLKSRFGWGMPVVVEPPELETRVAILMKKAEEVNIKLPRKAAFFLAERVRSNVRELEGALKRVIANAHFTGSPIDESFIKESLKDLLAVQDKQVSIDNIQKKTALYYKIRVADILSKRRTRSVARPRQMAMALAKELTNHSYPEIGDAFGGRDHTTVLHACRKIKELRETDRDIESDYTNLYRTLTV